MSAGVGIHVVLTSPYLLRSHAVALASVDRPRVANEDRHLRFTLFLFALLLFSFVEGRLLAGADQPQHSTINSDGQRVPWTTSRVTGSPDPPPPYRTVRAFPKLQFQQPLLLTPVPRSHRLLVAERDAKIVTFSADRDTETTELFADLRADFGRLVPNENASSVGSVYGVAFAPDFPQTPECYVCYTLTSTTRKDHLDDGTRVSRFRVSSLDPPVLDISSETVLLTWLEGGHNGGCLKFGPDGSLYISTGDAAPPNPPDPARVGQDITNVLSTIMRIDVGTGDLHRHYTVPSDNPFIDLPDARSEIWAYGFRNPWKMSFDSKLGELWVGDVGWEQYEMVYRVVKGGNFGWSVMEGPQPVLPNERRGPTEILPPAISQHHALAASVTGGYVYRGRRFPDLYGTYIYGDYETRRVWSATFDRDRVTAQQEIVHPTLRVVAFGEDHDGELLLVDFDDGTLHEFEKNATAASSAAFPLRLTDTGLFSDVARHELAAGVVPFAINAPQWMDGATARRFVGVPDSGSIEVLKQLTRDPRGTSRRLLVFPENSVLGKTIVLPTASGMRRIETQILHYADNMWCGYTYRWNAEQTDAELVDRAGATIPLDHVTAPARANDDPTADDGYAIEYPPDAWHVSGRGECMRCHNSWVGNTLAFTLPQLNRNGTDLDRSDNQLRALIGMGLLSGDVPDDVKQLETTADARAIPLVDPHDSAQELEIRARSYLHANCSHCHQNGAGGTATIDLRAGIDRDQMAAFESRPAQGTFGMPGARIIAEKSPWRSILYYRMAKTGTGRMPHIGSELVDRRGLQLVSEWIGKSSPPVSVPDHLSSEFVQEQLATTDGALQLATAVDEGRVGRAVRNIIVPSGVTHPRSEIRDLFERFLPPDRRPRRLGALVRPEEILSLTGDDVSGRRLFFESETVQCRNCHRIGNVGRAIGPELDHIARRNTPAELLDQILNPSSRIDPKFLTWTAETTSGQIHSGLLVIRTGDRITLRDARDQLIELDATDVEELLPQSVSLMPELLLRDLSPDDVADLLSFLNSLK